MTQWRTAKIEDVAIVMGGGTPSRTEQAYFGGGIDWATPTDITSLDGLYISSTKESITEVGLKNSSAKLMPAGAVLLTSRATIGFTAVSQVPICTNQGFINFICGPDLIPEYLAYWLRTQKDKLIQLAGGTTFKEITREVVRKFEISFPSIPEQRQIIDIISRAEGIVRLRREAEKKAAEIIPALFIDMFGDPLSNPKGWKVVPFSTFGECRLGKMLDKKKQSGQFQKPYLRNINVQWDRIDTDDLLEMDFNPDEQITLRLNNGDVLICEGGEIGRAGIWSGQIAECYFQKALHRLRPNITIVCADFVVWLFWHLARIGGFPGATSHATIAHLTGVQLKNMQVICPPIKLQEKFMHLVTECHSIQTQQLNATQKAEAAFDALLERTFSSAEA
jgi:type I restriction enzyme S subunit